MRAHCTRAGSRPGSSESDVSSQRQVDELDRAGGGVAEREDRVADAGGDDDRGGAELVAAVDEPGLEASELDVGDADDGVDLAAVGVAAQDEVDAIGELGGEVGV